MSLNLKDYGFKKKIYGKVRYTIQYDKENLNHIVAQINFKYHISMRHTKSSHPKTFVREIFALIP